MSKIQFRISDIMDVSRGDPEQELEVRHEINTLVDDLSSVLSRRTLEIQRVVIVHQDTEDFLEFEVKEERNDPDIL